MSLKIVVLRQLWSILLQGADKVISNTFPKLQVSSSTTEVAVKEQPSGDRGEPGEGILAERGHDMNLWTSWTRDVHLQLFQFCLSLHKRVLLNFSFSGGTKSVQYQERFFSLLLLPHPLVWNSESMPCFIVKSKHTGSVCNYLGTRLVSFFLPFFL